MSTPFWRTDPDRYDRCRHCDGTGRVACRQCDGKGHVYGIKRSLWNGRLIRSGPGYKPCHACNGSGGRLCGICVLGSILREPAASPHAAVNEVSPPVDGLAGNPFARLLAGYESTMPNVPSVARPAAPTPAAIRAEVATVAPAPQGLKGAHLVARVNRYYDRLGVAGLDVLDTFCVGDVVRVWNASSEFVQKVTSLHHVKQPIAAAAPGWQVGMATSAPVQPGDELYVVRPEDRARALGIDSGPGETPVGEVQHYYGRIGVAMIVLTAQLSLADRIRVRGRSTDVTATVSSMERDRKGVKRAAAGTLVGVRVAPRVHAHDVVYRLRKS